MRTRKQTSIVERTTADGERDVADPTTKVAAVAVVENPHAGEWADDLSELAAMGGELGDSLTRAALEQFDSEAAVESYGKGAVVGAAGEVEHGAAVLHPEFGGAMREAIGGGEAIIPSVRKVGGPGTTMDIPTHDKDDPYVLSHLDTMSVTVPDAPHEDELVVAVVLTDGGRPHPRIDRLV
jgi:hypothetical protein